MKLNLYKQIGLLTLLVLLFSRTDSQTQNNLLSPYLLRDSIALKTKVNSPIVAIVPLQSNVRKYVDQYLNENEEILASIKERNGATFKAIQEILVKRGIPAGLMYLAIVESELKNSATSGAGAAGIWQLMPETARTFGLKVNGKTDQRRHALKSSEAVVGYFKELYQQFDDWLLVVAAYNCGSGKVYKAIKLSGSRDFWKLQRYLPAETKAHVKHFIATHYYYEQSGSIVTLTKKERLNYLASVAEIEAKSKETKMDGHTDSANQPSNVSLVNQQDSAMIVEWRK